MIQHNGKTALVTGASRGFGRAVAEELAAEGWNLLIDGRNPERLRDTDDELSGITRVTAIAGDISDPEHRLALRNVVASNGGIDLLINNAGILGPSPLPSLLDYPIDELAEVFNINVLAPLAIIQTLSDRLVGQAVIVNVTSDAAVEAYPGWGGYGSAKSALEQISAVLAVENPRLTIYQFDPGDMRTDMHQEAFPGEDISDRPLPEHSARTLLALISQRPPSGRYRTGDIVTSEPAQEVTA